ncbi:MAG: 30S ribosomal protein S6 [Candidatus Latescibacteria bacterium]|nr:30S ribosomal protein S6 [Candidatus Latescibacterota bacterium]
MQMYETTFIIDGTVSDDEREAIIKRYEASLTDKGAEFERIVRWGKRQLAYEIKKRTRGYYVIFYFRADPAVINPFHREMDLIEMILRDMTLRSDGKHPDYIRDEGEPSSSSKSYSPGKIKDEERTVSEDKPSAQADETAESGETSGDESDKTDDSSGEIREESEDTEQADSSVEPDKSGESGKSNESGENDKGGE